MAFRQVKLVYGGADMEAWGTVPFTLTAAATTNATLVKAAPGALLLVHCINTNAAIRYLRFYDTNKVPTAGAGNPERKYAIPGSATGAGFVLQPMMPMQFLTGIGFTLTTGVADTDATALTANDVVLTLEYL
jgi:hypothetical protein